MNKIKEFYTKHKKVIIRGVIDVVGIGVSAIVLKKMPKKHMLNVTGKESITWKDNGDVWNLEEVKQCLDANAESSAMYAIFREGVKPDEYVIIALNGTEVL